MNYGMPGGPSGVGPPPPGSSQQLQHQMSSIAAARTQKFQQCNMMLQNGQLSQQEYQQTIQTVNAQYSNLMAQAQSAYSQKYGLQEGWRPGMQPAGKEMTTAEKKKYMQEMQKRTTAASVQQQRFPPMGYRPGMGIPQSSSAQGQQQAAMMPHRIGMGPSQISQNGQNTLMPGGHMMPHYPQSSQPGATSNMTGASPRMGQNFQPPTPQQPGGPPSVPNPGSVQAPGSVQSVQEEQEYMRVLKDMKNSFLDKCRALEERCRREKREKQKGFTQMLEILEDKRKVPLARLEKLKPSLVVLVNRECVTYPLLEEIRKMKSGFNKADLEALENAATSLSGVKSENQEERQENNEEFVTDPWNEVKDLEIRVPEFVRNLLKNGIDRKRKPEDNNEETAAKRMKLETGVVEQVPVKITNQQYRVNCVFDNRRPWEIPEEAQEELQRIVGWSVDNQCLPTCSSSPVVVICLTSQMLHCPPLRVAIPLRYPHEPAVVQFDRSFPQNTMLGMQLQKMFEKWVGVRTSARTITDFNDAFQSACNEFLCYHNSAPMIHGVPNQIAAPEYDAVVVTANKTSKIAHKGMVA